MDDKLKSESDYCRILPVSKDLGLEPVYVEGELWPSEEYYEQVSQLEEYVGTELYLLRGSQMLHNSPLESILRLDERMLYQANNEPPLFPHSLLFNSGNMINLSEVTHISLNYGFKRPSLKDVKELFEEVKFETEGSIVNLIKQKFDPSIVYFNKEKVEEYLETFHSMKKRVDKLLKKEDDLGFA